MREELKEMEKEVNKIDFIASEVQANRLERIIKNLIILNGLLVIGLVIAIIL